MFFKKELIGLVLGSNYYFDEPLKTGVGINFSRAQLEYTASLSGRVRRDFH